MAAAKVKLARERLLDSPPSSGRLLLKKAQWHGRGACFFSLKGPDTPRFDLKLEKGDPTRSRMAGCHGVALGEKGSRGPDPPNFDLILERG